MVSRERRPMALVRWRVSPKVRSMKLEWRVRWWCSAGKRRWAVGPYPSVIRHFIADGYVAEYLAAVSLIGASISTRRGREGS
jgi:hypothetical protein